MKSLPLSRILLVLGLLGGGALSADAALANPLVFGNAVRPWRPASAQQLGWVQAQRAWADQSHRQTHHRLNQLEQCLRRARQPLANEQCLQRDAQALELQWQRDQQEWQALMRRFATPSAVRLPWRPGLGI
ncbi:MAG: hypothetical protein AB1Z22_01655 [Synechococcaceae cyanobacterium]